jgi:predicted transglutaminase-like cysteine proteinase
MRLPRSFCYRPGAMRPPSSRRWGNFCIGLGGALLLGMAVATPDLGRMERLAGERYDANTVRTVAEWRRLISEATRLPEAERLEQANTFFNRRFSFKDDSLVWQQKDYWATPLEAMGKGAGDCEDYSIAKFMTLRLMGVPPEKLRMIYVKAKIGGPRSSVTQAHMVVGYYATPDEEPLILDNLVSELRPASRRADLSPVFTFNMDGLWVGGGDASAADPTARLSRWRDVLDRMREEGIL